jgi:hypothetical protein
MFENLFGDETGVICFGQRWIDLHLAYFHFLLFVLLPPGPFKASVTRAPAGTDHISNPSFTRIRFSIPIRCANGVCFTIMIKQIYFLGSDPKQSRAHGGN